MTLGVAEVIEVAKTGRARCRACRQAIEKGTLRFGEEQPSAFSDQMQMAWYHLACAARKRPAPVRDALAKFEGEVPDRAEIESLLGQAEEAVATHPYAERAPTGRSKCLQCGQPIAKDALRVAIEREVEVGGMPRMGSGYLHAACARAYLGLDDLATTLAKNPKKLADADRDELARALAAS
jgi:hypothetical protein